MKLKEIDLPNWDKFKIKKSLLIGNKEILVLKLLASEQLETPQEGVQNLVAIDPKTEEVKWIAKLPNMYPFMAQECRVGLRVGFLCLHMGLHRWSVLSPIHFIERQIPVYLLLSLPYGQSSFTGIENPYLSGAVTTPTTIGNVDRYLITLA
jgi:hypothetical protein